MNPEAKAELNRILEKDRNELTEQDKAFLRARREYLGKKTREDYKDIIKGKNEPIGEAPAAVDTNPFPPTEEAAPENVEVEDDEDDEDETSTVI